MHTTKHQRVGIVMSVLWLLAWCAIAPYVIHFLSADYLMCAEQAAAQAASHADETIARFKAKAAADEDACMKLLPRQTPSTPD